MTPQSPASSKKLHRSIRLGIATITSTALVGGVLVAVPAHPLLPMSAVAQAQTGEDPVETGTAYAQSQLINLDALRIAGILGTDDPRGLDAVIALIEAEQAWRSSANDEQASAGSTINVEVLEALYLDLGGIQIPLASESGQSLLKGDLGVLRSFAHAPASTLAQAASGAVSDKGALDVGSAPNAGNPASLDLTSLLGLSLESELVSQLSLELGAIGSSAVKNEIDVDTDYTLADAKINIQWT